MTLVMLLWVFACGDDATGADAGSRDRDGGGARSDAGSLRDDGGSSDGGGRADAGPGDPTANNPDGYAAATTIFRSADYETPGDDAPFEVVDVADLVHDASYGFDGTGAWRLIPHPSGKEDPDEGLAGWKWWPEEGMPPGTMVLVVTYMLYVSDLFAEDVARQNFPMPNYGINKIIDVHMFAEDLMSSAYETRQIVQMIGHRDPDRMLGLPAGAIYLAHVNGGAGGRYLTDMMNAPLDLAANRGQWLWIAHVFDARPGVERRTTTYYKRAGDAGVTRSLVRTESIDWLTAGTYEYTEHGWAGPPLYNSALWGYWGDLILPADPDRYVALDRLRSGDGWIDPPF
jgi:hypothetical protein